MKLRRIKAQKKPARLDMAQTDDQYRVEIKNRFQTLLEQDPLESTPEELWLGIRNSVTETAEKTVPKRKKKKKT